MSATLRLLFVTVGACVVAGACAPRRPPAPPPAPAPVHEEREEEEHEDEEMDEHAVLPSEPAKRKKSVPCQPDLAHCPTIGCAKAGSPHALFNELKRRTTDANGAVIAASSAKPITFTQLRQLQEAANQLFADGTELDAAQRAQLVDLTLPDGSHFGEGTAVRVAAFIAPDTGKASSGAHPGGIESVNCRLTGPDDKDVHIPIVAQSDQEECEGVVVEPIPQTRIDHPSWAYGPMRKVAKTKKLVMFVGPLFWDNEHRVNDDCAHLKTGQPKRMSLWEIHPVTAFYVCDTGPCKVTAMTGWKKVD